VAEQHGAGAWAGATPPRCNRDVWVIWLVVMNGQPHSACVLYLMIYRRVDLCACLVPQLMRLVILNAEYVCLCP